MTFSTERGCCEENPFCCVDHGPDCENEDHAVVTLEVWRALNGLCGSCGEPGSIPWGDPVRIHTLRCRRCALTQQLPDDLRAELEDQLEGKANG